MSQKTAARASSANRSWAQVVKSRPHRVRSDVRMQPAQTTWCITMCVVVVAPPRSSQRLQPLWAAPDDTTAPPDTLPPLGSSLNDSHLAADWQTENGSSSTTTTGEIITTSSSSSSSSQDVDEEDEDDDRRLELLHSSISGLEREDERAGSESIPSSDPGSFGRTQSAVCSATIGDGLVVVVNVVDMLVTDVTVSCTFQTVSSLAT